MDHLMVSGIPAFVLNMQLRMARGLFDVVAKVIYPDFDLTYGPRCDINHDSFRAGVALDKFFQDKPDGIAAPPQEKLAPIFVHCQGAHVFGRFIVFILLWYQC